MKKSRIGVVLAGMVAAGMAARGQLAEPTTEPATAASWGAGELPEELRGAMATARAMEAARIEAQLSAWDVADTLPTTDGAEQGKWRLSGGDVALTAAGMRVSRAGEAGAYATFAGKKWTLPLGVTYEAMIPKGRLSDVSMKLLPVNTPLNVETPANAVSLVVGGYGNTENTLDFLGQSNRNVGGPPLTAGKWTKVVLLMSTTTLLAMIDGQPVANEPMPARRSGQQLELTLYTFGEEATFRSVTVLKPKPRDNSVAAATAPAEASAAQKEAVEVAAKYLGDTRFQRRQAAAEALFMLRPASVGVLEEMKNGEDMELISRATALLGRIAGEGKPSSRTTVTPRVGMGQMPMDALPR